MTKCMRLGGALLALIAVTGLLSACGGGSSSSSTSSPPATETEPGGSENAGSGGEEATGEPIVVGTIGSVTGPVSWPFLPEFWKNYEAWINGKGGINGHPLEIKYEDDGGNAQTATKEMKELVESDGVQAIVGENSLNQAAWGKYLSSKGVPCVGCSYFGTENFSNPDFFPTGASLPVAFYGAVEQLKAQGFKKIASLFCAEAPECAAVGTLISKSAELQGGIESVAEIKVSSTAPSFASYCLAAKNAGAEALYAGQSSTVNERLFGECAQQNFEVPKAVSSEALYQNTDYPGSNHSIEIKANGPVESPTPYGKELREALGTMLEEENFDTSVSQSFAGLQMFRHVAEEAGLGPKYTSKELLAGLYEVKNETLKGGAGPLTYVKGKPTLTNCYFPAELNEGEWTELDGPKPVCSPVGKLVETLEALG